MRSALKVIGHAIQNPQHLGPLWHKITARVRSANNRAAHERATKWARDHASPLPSPEAVEHPNHWVTAEAFAQSLQQRAAAVLPQSNVRFGGGGFTALLHYLVLLHRPAVAVETGVAAGWSSAAILDAMHRNGAGRLWSSDFPYVTQSGARAVIGLLVPEHHRKNWRLFVDGDRQNLPTILGEVNEIDFFHYDSDKSYEGREFAWSSVKPKLAAGSMVVFDDIQDNMHFADLVTREQVEFEVFQIGSKFVGLLGRRVRRR